MRASWADIALYLIACAGGGALMSKIALGILRAVWK